MISPEGTTDTDGHRTAVHILISSEVTEKSEEMGHFPAASPCRGQRAARKKQADVRPGQPSLPLTAPPPLPMVCWGGDRH